MMMNNENEKHCSSPTKKVLTAAEFAVELRMMNCLEPFQHKENESDYLIKDAEARAEKQKQKVF